MGPENFAVYVIVMILALFQTRIESLRFDVVSGHTKCIAEDIKSSVMSVGKYYIVNPDDAVPLPDSHKLTVRVTSPHGNNYHYGNQVTEGNFAYHTVEAGDYMTCFFAVDHLPSATLTVDFDWKSGVSTKDWTSLAKKGSIEAMELELKRMYETVNSIHSEMFYLREREEEMQELNRTTDSQMGWLSAVSLLICLSVSGIQMWYLK
ncbi:unnamed protein product, partial [Cuscuta europaea]